MGKKELWDNFTHTGKIEDYLKYKKDCDEKIQEVITDADSSKWLSNNGIKFGRT